MSDCPLVCLLCGSGNIEDCGPVDDDRHHFECYDCGCGFPFSVLDGGDDGE